MSTRWSFDEKCMELAEHFLGAYAIATETDKKDFAQRLQEECEDICRTLDEIIATNRKAKP